MGKEKSKSPFIYKPIEITRDHRLAATMQDYLCVIAQLQNNGGCTASNSWFAEYFGVSRHAAIDVISKLKEKEFIESEIVERQGKKITVRELFIIDEHSKQSLLIDSKQSLPGIVSSADFDGKQTPQGKTKGKTKDLTGLFDQFWKAYPRKVKKATALKWWKSHKPDEALLQIMLAAIEQQKKSQDWTKDGGQFIPHPTTWLNGERWTDEESPGASCSPAAMKQYHDVNARIEAKKQAKLEGIRNAAGS